jgi:acyl-CoA synthetase (NDP forming)
MTSSIRESQATRALKPQIKLNLARLLRPRNIAVVGGSYAESVIDQCDRMGYTGDIWPVHPSREAIRGRPCVPSIPDLPSSPDAAFLGVNRHATLDLIRELASVEAGGAVVFASGFSETGEEGAALQAALVDAAGAMPFLGPNCYGFINYFDGALLWPDVHGGGRVDRGVALVLQSGNMGINLTMIRRALPIGYVITLGNQAQIGLPQVVEALAEDDRVTAVGLHIEGIRDAAALVDAVDKLDNQGIPVVALKTGRSAAGAVLTMSHTASLAGADRVVAAFLKRLGVARVHSLPALLETLKLLHAGGPLKGNRLVSMSCSGGEAALISDAVERHDIECPEFGENDRARIEATVNPLVTVSNPFDYHLFDWQNPDRLYETHRAVMTCDHDLTALLLDYPKDEVGQSFFWDSAVDAFVRASETTGRRAAVIATLPECMPEARAAALMSRGVTPLLGIDDALTAIEAAARVGRQGRPKPFIQAAPAPAGETRLLSEWDAKRLLARYDIAIPSGEICDNVGKALAAAEKIAAPVAMKALSPGLAHKTEAGALLLDLHGEDAVRAGFETLAAGGAQVLVEEMVSGTLAELIVGVARDPVVGLHMLLGAGGVVVEALHDSAVLLLPVDSDDVISALQTLRVWPLLDGWRGAPLADLEAIAAVVLAVQRLVLDHAESLEECEINPLMVRERGAGAVAADALVRLRSSR